MALERFQSISIALILRLRARSASFSVWIFELGDFPSISRP